MYKKLILTLSILLLSITSTYADISVHNYSNNNNTPQYIKDDLTNFLGFSGNNGAKIYDKNGTVLYSNAVSGNYYGDNLYTIELLNGDTIFFVGLTNSADSISYIHSAQYVYYYNSINNTIYKSILATEGQTGYYCRNSNKVGFVNNKLLISLKKESASNGNCTSGPTTALYEVDVTNHITSDNFLSIYNGILGNGDFKKFGNTGVTEGKIYQSGINQIHYLNNSGYLEYSYCDGITACTSYSDTSGLTINDYRLYTNGTDKSVISYEYDNGTLESIMYDNSNITTYTDTFYTYYNISNDNYKKISASNSIANTYMSSMVYLEDNNGTVDYYYISGTQQYTSVTTEPYVDNTGSNVNPDLVCETEHINIPIDTSLSYNTGSTIMYHDVSYVHHSFDYSNDNGLTTITTDCVGCKFTSKSYDNYSSILLDDNSAFDFSSNIIPWTDKPLLIIKSPLYLLDYIEITGTGTDISLHNCIDYYDSDDITSSDLSNSLISDINYNTKYYNSENSQCIAIGFTKDLTVNNLIYKIDYGHKKFNLKEVEICVDTVTGEQTVDGTRYNGSLVDLQKNGLTTGGTILSEGGFINNSYSGSINLGTIEEPLVTSGSCDMFSDTYQFQYYSNGSIAFDYSFESLGIPTELAFFGDSIIGVVVGPVNSFLGLIALLTPFGEESRYYCVMGTIIKYENHKLFKNTDYYNQMIILDYLIILGYLYGSFKLYRKFFKHSSNEENTN